MTAKPTLAMAIQIGNPISVKRAIRTLQRFNGVVEQATEQELADEAARADRTGMFNCPQHRRGPRGAAQARRSQARPRERSRGRHLLDGQRLKFADQKAAYHMGALEGVKPTHSEQARRAAGGSEARRPRHRAPRRENEAAGVLMSDPLETRRRNRSDRARCR